MVWYCMGENFGTRRSHSGIDRAPQRMPAEQYESAAKALYGPTSSPSELKIKRVAVKTYGEKASIEWGVAIMRMARIADPECKITFDVAAAIRPEQAHWMRQDHMVPATEAGFVTLKQK
eukprot:scaffold23428_cov77-Skeletonema_dohrnii-CCMP3373.AAC.1